MENKFNDKDIENFVKLLNFVSDKGKFEVNVSEVISFYKLLAWAQTDLKKKLEANVFEITRVVEAPKPEASKKGK